MAETQVSTKRKRLMPEDYFRFRSLHDPQLTADGRLAAVIVSQGDEQKDEFHEEILVLRLSDGHEASVHHPGSNTRALTFSPDGSKLAWIAGNDDGSHICLASVARLLDQGTGSDADSSSEDVSIEHIFEQHALGGQLHWSADGQNLFVTVPKPEPSKSGIRVYSSSRFKADGSGLVDPLSTEVWRVSVDGGTLARVFTWHDAISSGALSPDGRKYAFTAAHSSDTSVFVQDLFLADVETGQVTCLLEGRGSTVAPVFSPDSARIVCIASRDDLVTDGTVTIWTVDIETQTAHDVVPNFDRPAFAMGCSDLPSALSMSGPKFDTSGKHLRFLATDKGVAQLYEVNLPEGTPRVISPEHQVAVNQFATADDGSILYTASNSTHPDELYFVSGDNLGGHTAQVGERQLTKLNETLVADLPLREVQPFSCEGADGWPIEGFLQLPPDEEGQKGPYPMVLMIHGGPRGSFGSGFHYDVQALAAAGLAVLYVNPRGSDTYGKDFANAVINDWGNKDFQDLMAAVDAAVDRGYADPNRLGVTGYSYGGFMSTWVIGHTNRFKAAAPGGTVTNLVSFHGTSDIGWYWGPKQHSATVWENMEHLWSMSPLAYVENVQTPALLYHAEGDDRCPIGQTEEFFAALKQLGRDVTFVRYPKESHVGLLLGSQPSLRVDIVKRIVEWFTTRL